MNKLEKFLFSKIPNHKWENRFTWGELYLFQKNAGLAINFQRDAMFEDYDLFNIKIPYLINLYIHKRKPDFGCDFENKQKFMYGFYVYEWISLVIGRGHKDSIYWDFPWTWQWQKTEMLDYNFNTIWKETKKTRKNDRIHNITEDYQAKCNLKDSVTKTYLYKYTLKNGDIQNRTAKVSVDRRTWGMKWFPFIRKIVKSIDVEFNDEVGERTGSWKGGCIGCGYDMLPKETPEMTLRRMEIDRIFN